MRHHLIGLLLLAGVTACEAGPKAAAGFRLPDGDALRGRETFVALKCNACHTVVGIEMASPVADPAVPVKLGGLVQNVLTDGELVTSIINPSHIIALGHDAALVVSGEGSRMANYAETMTIQQLIDLVAFLHTTYTVVPSV